MERLPENILPALLALLMLLPMNIAVAAPAVPDRILVDGIVATIDDSPVLSSDILLEEDFGLLETAGGSGGFRELLDSHLNRLLIMKELDDIGGFRLMDGQAEEAFAGYLDRLGGRTAFEKKMKMWGVEEEDVFGWYKQVLLASLYTESRMKFLVKVVPSDIEQAYAEDPGRWGNVGIFEAWETIKSDLVGESFEVEKERWLSSLKKRYHLMMSPQEGEPLQ